MEEKNKEERVRINNLLKLGAVVAIIMILYLLWNLNLMIDQIKVQMGAIDWRMYIAMLSCLLSLLAIQGVIEYRFGRFRAWIEHLSGGFFWGFLAGLLMSPFISLFYGFLMGLLIGTLLGFIFGFE